MIYACALCSATCDGRGFTYGDWRVLTVGGRAHYVCPAHWPGDLIYEKWVEACRRNFEELNKLEPAKAGR